MASWRSRERHQLAVLTPERMDGYLSLEEGQVSNVCWSMGKDDRFYWAVSQQEALAEHIAEHEDATVRSERHSKGAC